MRVCDGHNDGSQATIKAIIQNIDKQECTTEAFESELVPNQYFESTNMGECTSFQIKESYAEVWIVNEDSRDSLCLSDVYLDVSSSYGSTEMMKCRLNERELKLSVVDNAE